VGGGPGGVRYPFFFPLRWQVTRVPPYVRRPFPSKENRRQISERDDLGPPVIPGGQEIGLGSRNLRRPRAEARPTGRAVSRERLGDWNGPPGGLSPHVSAKACHMAKR
jgi:hypothetical protein